MTRHESDAGAVTVEFVGCNWGGVKVLRRWRQVV